MGCVLKVSAKSQFLKRFKRSEAVERLEHLERLERSKAVERLERLEPASL
jgi:hypothetical protein